MDALREHILNLLSGKGAHIDFDQAVADFPTEFYGKRVASAPHNAWQLLEHLRIAQWDILEFSRDPKHVSPQWPDGYWPETEEPPTADAWEKSVRQYKNDLEFLTVKDKRYCARRWCSPITTPITWDNLFS
jgi:hypothetical protein